MIDGPQSARLKALRAAPVGNVVPLPSPRAGPWPVRIAEVDAGDLNLGPRTNTRLTDAEDALRAIGAGEVDAFVVSGGELGERVFSLATADRPYRMFVENMRDGAATVSAAGHIMYANQRLADLLGCPRQELLGQHVIQYIAEALPYGWDGYAGAPRSATPSNMRCTMAAAVSCRCWSASRAWRSAVTPSPV